MIISSKILARIRARIDFLIDFWSGSVGLLERKCVEILVLNWTEVKQSVRASGHRHNCHHPGTCISHTRTRQLSNRFSDDCSA